MRHCDAYARKNGVRQYLIEIQTRASTCRLLVSESARVWRATQKSVDGPRNRSTAMKSAGIRSYPRKRSRHCERESANLLPETRSRSSSQLLFHPTSAAGSYVRATFISFHVFQLRAYVATEANPFTNTLNGKRRRSESATRFVFARCVSCFPQSCRKLNFVTRSLRHPILSTVYRSREAPRVQISRRDKSPAL